MSKIVGTFIRPTLPDGTRPYLPAAFTGESPTRLRSGVAKLGQEWIKFPGADYYLRYSISGRRRYENVGPDADKAAARLRNLRFWGARRPQIHRASLSDLRYRVAFGP